ncbi:hypothetical protein CABS01_16371 [Colletotrichum abscissum]|uniref:uncharacterized protein n=1 Tax=Colletotrichum abscissum TaxID=1671311 RepID=UPI0027D5BB46|nr:uncharacterized protein CABS01_16371 [Colletotrichum abscissum]KAK1471328.1 hypothetical protein CABS01_16371 [Colletotrichum abscissum]
MPRITHYGTLGRGLQAVATEPGQIAYRKNEIIGLLFGEIVPAGTFDDDHTLDFVRPDLQEEPIVCQLRCADVGSLFRLLNHSCRPCAHLVQMRMSGKFVTTVQAIRDIFDGAQITISYGKNWKGDNCLCEVCRS